SWEFHPSVVIGCLVLWAVYLIAVRFKFDFPTLNYSLGILTMFVALCSPLDPLSDNYLFSAHMLQHMMLDMIAPPLLVSALRPSWIRSWLRFRIVAHVERLFSHALIALIFGVGTFWLWHLPVLYNATLENDAIHIFEHLTLMVTGCIMYWPVFK